MRRAARRQKGRRERGRDQHEHDRESLAGAPPEPRSTDRIEDQRTPVLEMKLSVRSRGGSLHFPPCACNQHAPREVYGARRPCVVSRLPYRGTASAASSGLSETERFSNRISTGFPAIGFDVESSIGPKRRQSFQATTVGGSVPPLSTYFHWSRRCVDRSMSIQ